MFQLEVARVLGAWQLALSATYKHWPAYPGPAEATVRCEDDDPPSDSCGAPVPPDPGYHPTVSPALGLDRSFAMAPGATAHLRAGYAFEPSPAPEQKARSNYFDNHRSIFSAGWGLDFDDRRAPLAFDGFIQLQWMHDRDHEKQPAEGAFSSGVVQTRGLILAGGAGATVRF
jgi:long-chain fatty acid transport protein